MPVDEGTALMVEVSSQGGKGSVFRLRADAGRFGFGERGPIRRAPSSNGPGTALGLLASSALSSAQANNKCS